MPWSGAFSVSEVSCYSCEPEPRCGGGAGVGLPSHRTGGGCVGMGTLDTRARNEFSAKFTQSRIRPLIEPSPGCLLVRSHLRRY